MPVVQLKGKWHRVFLSRLNRICMLWLIILSGSSTTLWAKVEVIAYRGWKNCYQISNALSKVIIVPESGGRVLAFTYGDRNIIYQDSSLNGRTFAHWQKTYFDPDGGRLDYGPIEEAWKL